MRPTTLTRVQQPMPACWRIVGVSGDRTCRELHTFIHCRNCPVLADAARAFFDRPAPHAYVDTWQDILAAPAATVDTDTTSVLVFRLGQEWFALPADVLVEVTVPRPLHAVPHRSGGGLTGIVNIRGQLQLCLSLHTLLGIAGSDPVSAGGTPSGATPTHRLLVVEQHGGTAGRWVLGVDEVGGVHRLPRGAARPVPSTIGEAQSRYSTALFDWQGRAVGLLDGERLFAGLADLLAS
jgi:chemotaxis-related protein WspD